MASTYQTSEEIKRVSVLYVHTGNIDLPITRRKTGENCYNLNGQYEGPQMFVVNDGTEPGGRMIVPDGKRLV